jgi:hypothetical protein
MKKALSHFAPVWLVLSIQLFSCYPTYAFETEAFIPQIEILTPGMTRKVEITQNYSFPLDFGHFLILVVGYGGVSMTLSKTDTEGDFIVFTGAGISSAGIAPFLKFGTTSVTLREAVEIGDQWLPYGLLWIVSWVDSPAQDLPAHYTLEFSF